MNEFEVIKTYFRPLAKSFPGALSLLDDAALLDVDPKYQLVITNDLLTAGVHFFENDSADLVARKSIRVNLSDIAAMGAEPLVYLLALGLPDYIDDSWLKLFSEGLKCEQINYGISLIGGDTSSTLGPISISITMLGKIRVNQALKKSTAKLGDNIWVSGNIGDAGVALKIINGEVNVIDDNSQNYLFERLRLPEPRVELGNNLIGIANSSTDISDGLASDLKAICQASGLGAVIKEASIPISDPVSRLIKNTQTLEISHILSAGDDYELIFTAPPKFTKYINSLAKRMNLKLSQIGSIVEGNSLRIIDLVGQETPLITSGFQHF